MQHVQEYGHMYHALFCFFVLRLFIVTLKGKDLLQKHI